MRIYDVCNDYSIMPSGLKEKPEGYNWELQKAVCTDEAHRGQKVVIEYGYCQSTGECHYVATESPVPLNNIQTIKMEK